MRLTDEDLRGRALNRRDGSKKLGLPGIISSGHEEGILRRMHQ